MCRSPYSLFGSYPRSTKSRQPCNNYTSHYLCAHHSQLSPYGGSLFLWILLQRHNFRTINIQPNQRLNNPPVFTCYPFNRLLLNSLNNNCFMIPKHAFPYKFRSRRRSPIYYPNLNPYLICNNNRNNSKLNNIYTP